MKKGYSFNDTEKLKRIWLQQIMLQYPKHQLSYFGMLTDQTPQTRKNTLTHFIDGMTNNGVQVLSRNSVEGYTKKDRYFYTQRFISLYKKDGNNKEVIFADPNTGFYSTNVCTAQKKHIDMRMIEMLMDQISDESVVYCFQYNQNKSYTRQIEQRIEHYIIENNLSINFEYQTFVSAKPQLKFYKFFK